MNRATKLLTGIGFVAGSLLAGYFFLPQDSPYRPIQSQPPTTATKPQKTPANSPDTENPSTPPSITPVSSPSLAAISKRVEPKQSASKEYVYHILTAPNDPLYSSDWPLQKVNAVAAWNIATGDNQTVVAVIDSGFALNHEDLVSQWRTNLGETGMTQAGDRCWTGTPADKQTNGCDDDNNGYSDDWRGWNFALNDNNAQTGRTNPGGAGVRHGTEVAGLVGATGNNNFGSTAINWNTKIMPLQALDDNGVGYTSDITAAIHYAVDNGAQAVNMSLGTYSNDPALKAAIDYATAHNVAVVAAAGNCGNGIGEDCAAVPVGAITYPALYPDVIAVGASTQNDQRASFSSYGPALDVMAPGYNLPVAPSWSADNQTSLYATNISGTSFSSPQVASLVSLLRSLRPSSSVQDIAALLDSTASKLTAMNGQFYSSLFGHGVINAGSALTIAQVLNTASAAPTLLQTGSVASEHSAPLNSSIASGCEITAGNACTVEMTDPSSGYKHYLPYLVAPPGGATSWNWAANSLEAYNWELRARNGDVTSATPYQLMLK